MTATSLFDPANPAHAKALAKLDGDLIAWFTTVRESGVPHSVPVWFLWRDGRILVLSEPGTTKVANVRRGSPVLVHLESGEFGEDVAVLTGGAELSERSATEWLADIREPYGTKYAKAIEAFGMPLDALAEKFSTVIVMTPSKLMAW